MISVSPFYRDPSIGAVQPLFRWQVLWDQRKAENIDRIARYTDNKANARRDIFTGLYRIPCRAHARDKPRVNHADVSASRVSKILILQSIG